MDHMEAGTDTAPVITMPLWEEQFRNQLRAFERLANRIPSDVAAVLQDPCVPWRIRTSGFAVVDSLDELTGPARGIVELPQGVLPGEPRRLFNLSNLRDTWALYGLLLWQASPDQLRAWINRDRLIRVWNPFIAPTAIRQVWENRFPELGPSLN